MTTQISPADPPAQAPARSPRRAAWSGWIGSALEYYDFALYAQASGLIFPTIFFPTQNAALAIISSLGTYAVGYIARPIGAVILGNHGDRKGRKNVLVFTLLLMGVATFGVGLLPTYAQVGIWAPVFLVILRLVQGFAVAGELGGSNALVVESAPDAKRGFFASFSLQGSQVGSILATAIMLPLAAYLPEAAFESWGWRIPFLLSALVVIAAYIIRRGVEEPPAYLAHQDQTEEQKTPVVELFSRYPKVVLWCILSALANVIGTTTLTFGPSFAKQASYGIGFSTGDLLLVTLITNTVSMLTIPIFGKLSDRFGRLPFMAGGCVAGGLLSVVFLWSIEQKSLPLVILFAVLTMSFGYQAWNATFATAFQEQFPVRLRVTGFAVSQNIGIMLAALTPSLFAAVAPPGSRNVPLIVGILTLVAACVAAFASLRLAEHKGTKLEELG